ncbi:MAG: type VII secretion target [Gordonia sp. (in: high G+C Gram-positive bacteria)]
MSVTPAALDTYAAEESTTAARLGIHQAATTDVSPLTMTFGVIGAEFLATLGAVLDDRRARLAALAARHEHLAVAGAGAAQTYPETDATAAGELTRSGIPAAGPEVQI